jgi:hypothetical protein
LKIFSQKSETKMAPLTKNFAEQINRNIGCQENRQFFAKKWSKSAKRVIDHSIGPGSPGTYF